MNRLQRIASDAFASLLAHKQRTLLMILVLSVGTSVLSATIVIGQGTQEKIMEMVRVHNLDMIMVRSGGEVQIFAPQADQGFASLLEADARAVETEVPNLELVSAVQNQRNINIVFEDRSTVTRAFGVGSDWADIRYRDLVESEFISDADVASMARVVILGITVANTLFPEGGAIGRVIRIENDPYTVKGIFAEVGAGPGEENFDNRIVVPYTTSSRRLFNRPYLEQIVMRVADTEQMAETAERVRALLRVRHSIGPGEQDDFFVREPEDVVDAAFATSSTMFTLMAAISIVALIAGGMVIMNMMLIAVSQRAREIGLRRAMGARASDITWQFLFESLFVALVGGFVGVVVGIAGASALAAAGLASSQVTWLPFAIALAACTVIGLAFGVFPARKAARIDPVQSLQGRMT